MAARRNKKVSRGNSHVTVYPWPHPQTKKQKYRFGWRKSLDDPWKYKTCATKGEAETLADEVLRQIDTGFLVWSGLDKDTQRFLGEVEQLTTAPDRETVLAFLKSRHKSAEVKAAAQRFMDFKIGNAGEETRHLGNVQRDVMGMADHFTPRPLLDIHDAELLEWCPSGGCDR